MARKFAAASSLSEALQHRLWASSDEYVRRALAKRADLAASLQPLAVTDPSLIAYWASTQRPASPLLAVAISNASDEHALMTLSSQDALSETDLRAIAARATYMVAWALLDHHQLPDDLRADLVVKYVAAADLQEAGFGRQFTERIGEDPYVWARAVAASNWNQAGLISAAVSAHGAHPAVQIEIVAALERLDEALRDSSLRPKKSSSGTGVAFPHPITQTVSRAGTGLLRFASLSREVLDRLARIPSLTGIRSELESRSQLSLAEKLDSLSCTLAVHTADRAIARDHAAKITDIINARPALNWPSIVVVQEALAHHDLLDEATLDSALSLSRGPESRLIATQLYDMNMKDELLLFASTLGTLVLDQIEDPTEVLLALARQGHRDIAMGRYAPADATLIARAYQPASDLLHESALLSIALEQIERLPARQADTALALLGEWSGDLDSLILAAAQID